MAVLDNAIQSYPRNQILEPAVMGPAVVALHVRLKPSTTFIKGQAIAESVATPGQFAPYNSSGSDGETNPTAVMKYNCTTDSSGNITLGTTADPAGRTYQSVEAYFGGVFKTAEIFKDSSSTAIDSTVAGKLGKLIRGTLTSGLIWIR